ncbi:TIR domain-containing protein [Nitrosomonas supralitoralis]|uniref:DNA-binding protein n=1 Tax=Nitrosomonas supralitoralis TaxID=2116706 RepID=A0A2P7NRX5_9PROT|nr:nucleotide-binding protein [Nitrosomonas supralitoralis]PSJ16210.1 DNA-binding protein [Nitrosomonas supralitoralis]
MSKFKGTFKELQSLVDKTRIGGEWKDLGNQKQFKTNCDAVLNWWESSKTIQFQGDKVAALLFEKSFTASKSVDSEGYPDTSNAKIQPLDKKIFVVHGHDTAALEQLELVLRRLGLAPYILQNNDGHTRTLIEALEQQIYDRSAFGIILMTPDDYGYPKTKTENDRQPRARQNVILEMGMVMASLGRDRIVILKKGNLEMPSDVNGIIYLEFNEHVKEVVGKLAQRIQSSGIEIEDNLIVTAAT